MLMVMLIHFKSRSFAFYFRLASFLMGLVPLDALIKRHSRATEDVQRTPNGQVHLAFATNMYFLQVL